MIQQPQQQPEEINQCLGNAPKLKPVDIKTLFELENDSNLNKTITTLLKSTFFEQRPVNWKPVKYELVVNTKLNEEFLQIKSEFQQTSSDQLVEFEDKYGFLIETDAQVNYICQYGYSCVESPYNVLGQSKAGVYLSKYSDVCLRNAEFKKWPEGLTKKMIIFKILHGKQTLALVRKNAKLQPISPTIGFNSHCSVISPKEKDDVETQFDQSQIYLYEFNNDKTSAKRPRHCLPYIVVTWLNFTDGTEWPHNFSECEGDVNALLSDALQAALLSDDEFLKTKLKETHGITEEYIKPITADAAPMTNANGSVGSPSGTNGNAAENNGHNEEQTEAVTTTATLEGQKSPEPTDKPNGTDTTVTTNGPPASTPTSTPTTNVQTTTTAAAAYQYKPNLSYQKTVPSYVYRQPSAASLAPYMIAQSPNPYNAATLRLPYYAAQQQLAATTQQLFAAAQSPFANMAAQQMQQQPMYLCRAPNGMTYLTAAPTPQFMNAQVSQQAQYIQQIQQAQAAAAAAAQMGIPAGYKVQAAVPQVQQQIIYQAAPQPAQPAGAAAAAAAAANKQNILTAANNQLLTAVQAPTNPAAAQAIQAAANAQQQAQNAVAAAQTQVNSYAPPPQSPKQPAANTPANQASMQPQYATAAQYQALAAAAQNQAIYAAQGQYNQQIQQQINPAYQGGQQTYLTYANPNGGGNIVTSMGGQAYYANPQYVVAQQQPGAQQAMQAQAQGASIYGYAGAALQNGYAAQQTPNGQVAMAIPGGAGQQSLGYQILDYRQVQGLNAAAAVQMEQLQASSGLVQRPRIVNLRHHPYQRN